MRSTLFTLLVIGGAVLTSQARPVQPSDDIVLQLPTGWIVTDTPGYPLRIVNSPPSAEMLIFRSQISPDELVRSAEDLRLSVDAVVEEVILPLPEAKLLTNTGTYDVRSTGFILEFTSLDTELGMTLQHRFKGQIFSHPDGHQMLYTLWARGTVDEWPYIEPTFIEIQESFDYAGPQDDAVFGTSNWSWQPIYYATALVVVLLLIMVLGRRQARLNQVKFSDNVNVWRCECGRMNHTDVIRCRRCGRDRTFERSRV